jgi:hypothetical protein
VKPKGDENIQLSWAIFTPWTIYGFKSKILSKMLHRQLTQNFLILEQNMYIHILSIHTYVSCAHEKGQIKAWDPIVYVTSDFISKI